jgi:hypothetical protein
MREKLFILNVKLLLYGYFATLSSRRYMASETGQLARDELEGTGWQNLRKAIEVLSLINRYLSQDSK